MKVKIKRIIMTLVYLISVFYFYKVIKGIEFESFSEINNWRTYAISLILVAIHSVLLTFVAYIYAFNLITFSSEKIKLKNSTLVSSRYLLANIAKYVPGNIVHYVGRNALLAEKGYKHKQIAFSSLFEIGMLAITCLSIAILTSFDYLLQQIDTYINLKNTILTVIVLGVIGVLGIYWYLKKFKQNLLEEYKDLLAKKLFKRVVLTFLYYSVYFIMLSTTLLIILYTIFGISFPLDISLKIIGLFIVAYFVGMVAPGVPGGVGIREAVAIALISQYVDMDILFIAVILLRFITVLGDMLSFVYGKVIDYRFEGEKNDINSSTML